MKKLYLVDVSSFFFRAFYAIPHLTNPEGMPTNALYGFLSMTIKLLREVKPEYMAFCFDRKDGSFRLDLYEDYKANRGEMPEDLKPQVPYVKELTDLLGIPRFEKKGFEADDLIGSLVEYGKSQGLEVVIVSGDKDFAQLIGPSVTMYDTMKNVKYDEAAAMEKWLVKPEQMIDYLAIVGDSSDNVPGVKGIGPKGAAKLLAQYENLDGIYKNIEEISGKSMKAKLIENKELAYLSQKLVTIVTDVDLVKSVEDLQMKEINKEDLQGKLEFLGFKSFQRTLLGGDAEKEGDKSSNVSEQVKKSKKIGSKNVTKKTSGSNSGFIATEDVKVKEVSKDDFLNLVSPYSELWGFLVEDECAFGIGDTVFKVEGDPKDIGQGLEKKIVSWKGFDLKAFWRRLNIKDQHCGWDSMLAAYVVRAGNTADLPKLFEQYTGRPIENLDSPVEIYSAQREMEEVLREKVEEVRGVEVMEKFELPAVPVLTEMEARGILLNSKELESQGKDLEKDIQKITKNIYELANVEFNISSPKQLSEILFEDLGLTPGKKTKTGYSTNSDVLEKLKSEHPIIEEIIEYRELTKLKSTYVDALPELVSTETGRLHTHLRQAATTTGRLSSTNPNLQNIPIRTKRGRAVRRAFEATKDHLLLSVDYSQIELRVLAHITEDPGLLKAFNEDLDIHAATASEIFSVDIRDVTSDLRRTAKAVNFGIAYGQGAYGLAETLGISRSESKDIISKYFIRFEKVKDYMETIVESAKETGYVETMFGRRRYIDELKSKNPALRKFGERAAINAPIQGSASDLVKLAMIEVYMNCTVPCLLQVHDELLFEVPKDRVEDSSQRIQEIMESVADLKVPLKVNVASGKNWEAAHA